MSKQDKQELTSEITAAALRLNNQLENLLNTSRLESGFIKPNFEWCDVNELVYNTLNKLQKKLSNHKTQIDIDDNLPLVKFDFGLMEQILTNLISNAVNYTPEQTLITLKAYLIKEEGSTGFDSEKQGDFSQNTKSYTLKIEISDNGNGIPVDEIAAVFTKFYRLDNTPTGGTGLGLFIAKGFVEAQGGTIKVLNKINSGALFVIELPTPILLQTIHHE